MDIANLIVGIIGLSIAICTAIGSVVTFIMNLIRQLKNDAEQKRLNEKIEEYRTSMISSMKGIEHSSTNSANNLSDIAKFVYAFFNQPLSNENNFQDKNNEEVNMNGSNQVLMRGSNNSNITNVNVSLTPEEVSKLAENLKVVK